MTLPFLSYSTTRTSFVLKFKQFHNCFVALANTAVYLLSLNSKTAIAFSLKAFTAEDIFCSQSYLCKVSNSLTLQNHFPVRFI